MLCVLLPNSQELLILIPGIPMFLVSLSQKIFWHLNFVQITERKPELAKLEAIDCGKPLEEAAWDMVGPQDFYFVDSQYASIYSIPHRTTTPPPPPPSHTFSIIVVLVLLSTVILILMFYRMMLLVVLSTTLILLKVWMQSRILLSLFQWTLLKVMFARSLLE